MNKKEKADKILIFFFSIVDFRYKIFKEHFTADNYHNSSILRIKLKLKEIAKDVLFVSADKTATNFIIV